MQSQKPYLISNGEIYKHIYSSSIYWWSDLKIDELHNGPSESDPLDFISYHFNYWEHKEGGENIRNELNNIIKDRNSTYNDYLNPELIIYEFGGILVQGEDIDGDSRQEIGEEIVLKIKDTNDRKIYIPKNDFEFWDLGSFDDYDDEDGNIKTEFIPSSDTLLYFMRDNDYEIMNNYLEGLINKLDSIYLENGLPSIF